MISRNDHPLITTSSRVSADVSCWAMVAFTIGRNSNWYRRLGAAWSSSAAASSAPPGRGSDVPTGNVAGAAADADNRPTTRAGEAVTGAEA
ncbi:hypothetical protein ON010_g11603 [Phytophthora cinnamomi]|nr:hypothetical protein ON010_g11603 [Phytophthora cinnamomi]